MSFEPLYAPTFVTHTGDLALLEFGQIGEFIGLHQDGYHVGTPNGVVVRRFCPRMATPLQSNYFHSNLDTNPGQGKFTLEDTILHFLLHQTHEITHVKIFDWLKTIGALDTDSSKKPMNRALHNLTKHKFIVRRMEDNAPMYSLPKTNLKPEFVGRDVTASGGGPGGSGARYPPPHPPPLPLPKKDFFGEEEKDALLDKCRRAQTSHVPEIPAIHYTSIGAPRTRSPPSPKEEATIRKMDDYDMTDLLPDTILNNMDIDKVCCEWLDHFKHNMTLKKNHFKDTFEDGFRIPVDHVKMTLAVDGFFPDTIDQGFEKACQKMHNVGWDVQNAEDSVYFSHSS
jgi:hypothetical protein